MRSHGLESHMTPEDLENKDTPEWWGQAGTRGTPTTPQCEDTSWLVLLQVGDRVEGRTTAFQKLSFSKVGYTSCPLATHVQCLHSHGERAQNPL